MLTDTQSPPAPVSSVVPVPAGFDFRSRLRIFVVLSIILILCFIQPLYELVRFSIGSELYSHILLIPFISAYLIWLRRKSLGRGYEAGGRRSSVLFFTIGVASLGFCWWLRNSGQKLQSQDYLALTTFSYLCFLAGICRLFLGRAAMRPLVFPLVFLVFMIPFPAFIERGLETALQHSSAITASGFFALFGMPVFRTGMDFRMPGFSMQVAPECSGIHSTLVLVITSLLAGYLLLERAASRAAFALAVIPLGILRNAFRIFLLGELCVHVSPQWINSDLHHRGGPIFFALSLAPFFLLLWWLRKRELKARDTAHA